MSKNAIYLVEWSMWTGKSLLISVLSVDYAYVYANFKLESKVSSVQKMIYRDDIFALASRRDKKKWMLIIDEWQKYLNRRRSMSKENKEMWDLTVLSRKANLDIYIIVQNWHRLDEQLTWFVDYKITMLNAHEYINSYWYKDVDVSYCVQKKSFDVNRKQFERVYVDIEKVTEQCVYIMNKLWVKYDTFDSVELKKRIIVKENNKKDENVNLEINKLIL